MNNLLIHHDYIDTAEGFACILSDIFRILKLGYRFSSKNFRGINEYDTCAKYRIEILTFSNVLQMHV